jgi:DNA-binding NarL/FixJ family response regulator
MNARKTRILIVDDHPMMREGLAIQISSQPDMEVCGAAEDVRSAMELVRSSSPDLVLIDVSLKDSHGLDLI